MAEGFAFATEHAVMPVSTTVPWARGCEKLFSVSPKAGTGKGEMSVAAMLLNIVVLDPESVTLKDTVAPFISGQGVSFDINITDSKIDSVRKKFSLETANWRPVQEGSGKTEVKMPGDGGNIRLGDEGMRAVIHGFPFFWELAREVEAAVIAMDEFLELMLPKQDYDDIRLFVEEDVPDINRICLSKGRALGDEAGKYSKQKFGFYQTVRALSRLKKARLNIKKSEFKVRAWTPKDKANSIFLTGTPTVLVGMLKAAGMTHEKMVRELKKLNMNNLQVDILRYLNHPAFDDPEMIKEKFAVLAPPVEAFAGVDRLALVSKTHVRFIPKDSMNNELSLTQIAQGGRPSYSCVPLTSNAE